jgi:resuscitation-promoting factor RpfA
MKPITPAADAFDHAAKQALREAPLPAPPAWLDEQLTAAARAQAQAYAQARPAPPRRWWEQPWLKVALPTVALATLLVTVWLPHTEVTPEHVVLPQAARNENVPSPAPAPAPASAPAPAAAPETSTVAAAPQAPVAVTQERAKLGTRSTPPSTPRAAPQPLPNPPAPPESAPALEQARAEAMTAPAPAAPPVVPAPAPADAQVAAPAAGAAPASRPLLARTRETTASPAVSYAGVLSATQDTKSRARAVNPPNAAQLAELQTIRSLLQEGKRQEAAEKLNALRVRFPDIEIPEDLRLLLPKPSLE